MTDFAPSKNEFRLEPSPELAKSYEALVLLLPPFEDLGRSPRSRRNFTTPDGERVEVLYKETEGTISIELRNLARIEFELSSSGELKPITLVFQSTAAQYTARCKAILDQVLQDLSKVPPRPDLYNVLISHFADMPDLSVHPGIQLASIEPGFYFQIDADPIDESRQYPLWIKKLPTSTRGDSIVFVGADSVMRLLPVGIPDTTSECGDEIYNMPDTPDKQAAFIKELARSVGFQDPFELSTLTIPRDASRQE